MLHGWNGSDKGNARDLIEIALRCRGFTGHMCSLIINFGRCLQLASIQPIGYIGI